MKPNPWPSHFRNLAFLAGFVAAFPAWGQPLYQWTFDGAVGTPSVTAGGGVLLANGTASFAGTGVTGLPGNNALELTNAYTGGVGTGNSVVAGGANVLTGIGTLTNFTITMWVKLTPGDLVSTAFPRFLQLGATATPDSGSNPGISLLLNNGGLEVGVNGKLANIPSGFSAGAWRFIAVSYDGATTNAFFSTTNRTLYGTGFPGNAVVLSGSTTNSVVPTGSGASNAGTGVANPAAIGATATLYLGNRADGNRGFTGSLDDVRIYNTQLTVAQLEAIRLESAPPPPESGAPHYWKGDAGTAWNTANWTSDLAGTAPATLTTDGTAAATFAATGAINLDATVLGANQHVKSLIFNTQATTVGIGGTHDLTIGDRGVTLDADAGNVSIHTTGQVVLGADQTWTNKAATDFTVSSVISGPFVLSTSGPGRTVLSGSNTHAGTTVESGALRINNVLALGPVNTPLQVNGGTLDLNGLSPQVGSLSGTTLGIITNLAEGTTSTLVVNSPAPATDVLSARLNNGSPTQIVALTKTGPGSLALATTNNFTGNVLVSEGTLVANSGVFGAPNASNLGNAQVPGRTVTIASGATLRFASNNVFGNQLATFFNLPKVIVENGGTLHTTRYGTIGDITLNGGTLSNASTEGGLRYQAFQFKGTVTAGGSAASTISASVAKGNHLDGNTAFEVGAGSSLTISASLVDQSGDFAGSPDAPLPPGGFTKYGPGTLTLSGVNTYTGPTTLAEGKLVLATATSLSDTANFEVNNPASATLELNFAGTEVVGGFTLGGSSPGPGTYGAIGSGATHTYAWITGTGRISIGAPATSPLQDWRLTHFLTTEDAGDAANTADPDHDGIANLLEYALGGDPLAASPSIAPVQAIAAGHLTLTFDRIADPSLTYRVLATDDLTAVTWPAIFTSTGEDNTDAPVTVTDPELISAHPRRFLRLSVEVAP